MGSQQVEREARKKMYTILREHRLMQPKGGENGVDGYWDVEIKSEASGTVTQVIMRNAFDILECNRTGKGGCRNRGLS